MLERVLAQVAGRPVEVACYFEDEISDINRFPRDVEKHPPAEDFGEISGVEAAEEAAGGSGNPALDAALKIFGGTVQEVRYESERG